MYWVAGGAADRLAAAGVAAQPRRRTWCRRCVPREPGRGQRRALLDSALGLWMTGTRVLTGGAAATGPVGAAVAEPDPTALAAVTTTVMAKPSSALVSSRRRRWRRRSPDSRAVAAQPLVAEPVWGRRSTSRCRRCSVRPRRGAGHGRGGDGARDGPCPDRERRALRGRALPGRRRGDDEHDRVVGVAGGQRVARPAVAHRRATGRPSASQRRQSYVKAGDGNVQRPASPVSVSPTYALPAMLGAARLSSANWPTWRSGRWRRWSPRRWRSR